MQKTVFFEDLSSDYRSILNLYRNNGFQIYYFSKDNKIGKFLPENSVDISKLDFEHELYPRAANIAFTNLDSVFEKYFSTASSIKEMSRLLEYPETLDMYKKELLFDLEKAYLAELKINEIIEKSKLSGEVHFIPKNYIYIHSDKLSPLNDKVRIKNYQPLKIKIKTFFERLFLDNLTTPKKGILPLFYPIYLFFRKFKGISNNIKPEKFKVGITIARHPTSIFDRHYLFEDVLIHDREFPKKDVLFIDENGSKNIDGYKKKGYNYTRLLDDREVISLNLFWNKIIKDFLPIWIRTVFLSLSKEPYFIDTKRRILQDYILWNIFFEKYKIKNYIKRHMPDNISKMHIISSSGVKTWIIRPDQGAGESLDWTEIKEDETRHSFYLYNNIIVYGNRSKRWIRKNRNNIKNYHKVGVLFAQIIRELQKGKLKSTLPSLIKDKKLPATIIGVFDTAYNRERAPLREKDGIKFGEDILKLLEEMPNIGIVFKAKRELETTPFLKPIYEKLKNHNRCLLFAKYGQGWISSSEVIAVSDFVISAVFTSPTADALAARKKTVYYDVSGKYKGEGFYYNKFPNFVAHSYEELKKLINYWLYEVTDDEFEEFLDEYVKNEIDPYLDGKALTRARRLLMGNQKCR